MLKDDLISGWEAISNTPDPVVTTCLQATDEKKDLEKQLQLIYGQNQDWATLRLHAQVEGVNRYLSLIEYAVYKNIALANKLFEKIIFLSHQALQYIIQAICYDHENEFNYWMHKAKEAKFFEGELNILNKRDDNEEHVLFIAARQGNINIIESLIRHGADINVVNNQNQSILIILLESASRVMGMKEANMEKLPQVNRQQMSFQILIENCKHRFTQEVFKSALYEALRFASEAVIIATLKRAEKERWVGQAIENNILNHPYLDTMNGKNVTYAFLSLIKREFMAAISLALDLGADTQLYDSCGNTLLALAIKQENFSIIKLIWKHPKHVFDAYSYRLALACISGKINSLPGKNKVLFKALQHELRRRPIEHLFLETVGEQGRELWFYQMKKEGPKIASEDLEQDWVSVEKNSHSYLR